MGRDLYRRRCPIRAQAKPLCAPLLRCRSKSARRSQGRADRRALDAEDRFERIEKGRQARQILGGIRFESPVKIAVYYRRPTPQAEKIIGS